MAHEIRFALYAIRKNIQSSAELRSSFLMNIVGMAINNTAFIILWTFFVQSVGVIGGWTAIDVIGLQGFSALSYGIVNSVAIGIRKIPEYAASGAFDRFMLSPKNLLMRIATSTFSASAVGDVIFGIVCLVIYGILLDVGLYQVLMIIALVITGAIVFLAMTITIFSFSFFFMDSSAVTNGFLELFITPMLFHGGAFQGALRFVFTFIIPSLVIGALPVETVRDLSLWKLGLIALLAIVWFFLSLKIFEKAVKRYESSNFMTFGS